MTVKAAAKKSQKRHHSEQIKTLTRHEFNRVAAKAGRHGLTVDEYVRTCMGYAYPA
jgi:hypothetical protein